MRCQTNLPNMLNWAMEMVGTAAGSSEAPSQDLTMGNSRRVAGEAFAAPPPPTTATVVAIFFLINLFLFQKINQLNQIIVLVQIKQIKNK